MACMMHSIRTHKKQHESNLTLAVNCLQQAAANGAQLVVLPEMWNCPYSNDSFPTYAEDIDGGDSPSVAALSEVITASCAETPPSWSLPTP